ncbi:MAG: D-glycero-beta-D-manno-heptose 1-phosphate adenylyltransferase [Deltaproteobacteria bacterium]
MVGRSPYRCDDKDKIVSLEQARSIVRRNRELGRRTIFTNGCFDILHAGHVVYLEQARKQGDYLIVGLNSDQSIRALKGPDRPVNGEEDRARVLAALGCVDLVVLFEEETPLTLIRELLPDVLVKGADWAEEEIVGAKEVKEAGGRVVRVPLVDGRSTTGVIKRLKGGD